MAANGEVPPFDLGRYKATVFDLDGTVWLSGEPMPGAREFLDRCRSQGATIVFATNAIVSSPEQLSSELVACGLALPDEPVVTAGTVIVHTVLAARVSEVVTVAPPALHAQLSEAGIEVIPAEHADVDAWRQPAPDRALVMASSRAATIGAIEVIGRLAAAGHPMYLSSRDPGFPTRDGMEPGGGMLLAAARALYEFEPTLVGKPSQYYADTVADVVGGAGPIAVFGDSQRSDIGIAHRLGADGVLVTGRSVVPISPDLPAPTYVTPALSDDPVPA
jgi:HAD superfamily hydrolase (TIGR01450 family)